MHRGWTEFAKCETAIVIPVVRKRQTLRAQIAQIAVVPDWVAAGRQWLEGGPDWLEEEC